MGVGRSLIRTFSWIIQLEAGELSLFSLGHSGEAVSWKQPAAAISAPRDTGGDRISMAFKALAPPAHQQGPWTHRVQLDEFMNFPFLPKEIQVEFQALQTKRSD